MMKKIMALSLFISSQCIAADISGKLEVLKKNSNKPEFSALNGLVYLTGITTPPPTEVRQQTQKNKQFTPRILAVVKGQETQFINNDRVQHNVFSTNKLNPFDLGRYPNGESRSVTFNNIGIQPVYCDIHQSMVSYIAVLENHYYAYTNQSGEYRIKDIPAGTYKLNVWHIYGGKSEQTIVVTEVDQTVNISVKSHKVVRDLEQHKNKLGRQYQTINEDDY